MGCDGCMSGFMTRTFLWCKDREELDMKGGCRACAPGKVLDDNEFWNDD